MNEKILNYVETDELKINENPFAESEVFLSNDNQSDIERDLYKLIEETIREQYEEALDATTTFIEEEEGKELRNIKLYFTKDENNNYLAWANYSKNSITFNLSKCYKPQILKAAIHEISHLIVGKYLSKRLSHSLEFAIICYCIQYKTKIRTEDFFTSYDIREEISKPFLKINFAEFDYFIQCINWNSLQELAEKSKILADEIRKNSVPLNLF